MARIEFAARLRLKEIVMIALSANAATGAAAQTVCDCIEPTPLGAITNEAPRKLFVDSPLAERLTKGLFFIQYLTENLRVVPVYGVCALDVSPRVGHVHTMVPQAAEGTQKAETELRRTLAVHKGKSICAD